MTDKNEDEVQGSTTAIIGDAGPEAVVPLKKVVVRKKRPAWHTSGPIPSGGAGAVVKRVQEIVGAPLTGKLDRVTSNAVRVWQINAGLPGTGRVDGPTRKAMGI